MSENKEAVFAHISRGTWPFTGRNSIRQRLVFIFVLLVLLPTLLMAIIFGALGANAITEQRLDRLRVGADFKAVQIVEWRPVATVTVVGTVVGLALAVLAIVLIERGIVRPLRSLSQVVARIADGERAEMVALERPDEIGILARAFEQMTQHLQQQMVTLETHAAECTSAAQEYATQLETASRVARQIAVAGNRAPGCGTPSCEDDLLTLAAEQIAAQFSFEYVGIFLIDDARQFVQLRGVSSPALREELALDYKVAVGGDDLVGSVASLGQPRILNCESVRPLRKGAQPTAATHPCSQVGLPLVVRGQVIGVVDIHSQMEEAFAYDKLSYLQAMTEPLSLALDNLRLLATAEAQLGEVQQLMRMQNQNDWVRLTQNRLQWGYTYDGTEVKSWEQASVVEHSPQLSLPIQGGHETIGKLNVFVADDAPFRNGGLSARDQELAEAVVEQAGQAMESARLFNKMQTALEEVGVLYRGSQALGAARTAEEVLRAFVDYLIAPGIDRCVLALLESQTQTQPVPGGIVRIEAAWDAGRAHSPLAGDRWLVDKIPVMQQTTHVPLAIADVMHTEKLDAASRQVFREILRVRAFLVVPLKAREQLLGWLLVAALRKPYAFVEREIRVYRSMADQAAIVLQSMRLITAATQRAERERSITEMTAEIRRHTDVDTILQTSIRELGQALRASDGLIRLGVKSEQHIPKTQPLRSLEEADWYSPEVAR